MAEEKKRDFSDQKSCILLGSRMGTRVASVYSVHGSLAPVARFGLLLGS